MILIKTFAVAHYRWARRQHGNQEDDRENSLHQQLVSKESV